MVRGPIETEVIFFSYYYFTHINGFLMTLTYSKTHQTLHKNQSCDHLTYFMDFASGRGLMAPQRPLEIFKNS